MVEAEIKTKCVCLYTLTNTVVKHDLKMLMAHTTNPFLLTLIPIAGWLWLSFIHTILCLISEGQPLLGLWQREDIGWNHAILCFQRQSLTRASWSSLLYCGVGEKKMVYYSSPTGKAENTRDR